MKTTKKLLSVLLAVLMIMSSMSVCFGTISFAAGGTATAEQWTTLANALANDTIKGASFTGSTNNKTVDDPDGKVIAAVEAYFAVVNAIANKAPACGNPSKDTNVTGSTEGNRTINQVNTTIKNEIASRLGADYTTYNVDAFLTGLLAGANVSDGKGSQLGGRDTTNDSSAPGTNLSAIGDIKITVTMAGAVTGYTLDTLPDNVVTSKSFTVKHTNSNYDYSFKSEKVTEGSGCNAKEVTYYSEYYYYFYNISAVSSADGASVSTQTIKDSASTLGANADYFSKDLDALVDIFDATTLGTVKTAVTNAKANVVNAFGATVYNHFFSAYNVEALTANINKAVDIIAAANVAIELDDLVDAGYADIITNKGALETLASNVKTLADKYDAYAADVKAYVESHEYEGEMFVRADATDFYNAILKEIELIELRALKATIETEVIPFLGYNEDNVADRTVSGTELNYAKGTVDGWISALNTYADANVAEVWGDEDIDAFLAALSDNLEFLITVNGYTDDFANRYAYYVSTVYANTNVADDSEELIEAVKNYDSWYTGLKALIAEIETELGTELADKIFTELDTAMKAHLDSKYNALHARSFAQIDLADKLYKELNGQSISILNVNTYAAFEDALGHVDVDLYNFLLNSPNFDMPQLTIDEFNEIWTLALGDYHNFLTSGGFDRYVQTEIADIVRPEEDTDNHDAHIGDYTVTDEKVEKIITLIDELLADDDIKALLGGLINKDKETGEPTGEPFDLKNLINGLIDGLFNDDLLNTIMGFLYPAVTKEFAKVWAGLPESITVEDVDTGLFGLKADVTAYLDLYTCEKATHAIGMSIFPIELAEKLRTDYGTKYEAVAAVLDDVTIASAYQLNGDGDADDTYNGDPWKDEKLYVNVLDENGEPVLNDDGTNKTKLNLVWGIDEAENKRKAFIDAAVAGLSGIEPLLLALLSNQYYESTNKIGTGSGSASVLSIPLNLVVDPIDLKFMVTNNPGYNNVLAPIFELLGVTAPDGNKFDTIRKVLEDGLFNVLDDFLTTLSANPLETILNILPNAMYAISAGRILPLLDLLNINIDYTTNASYEVLGMITGSMNDVYKSEEPIKFNVKSMINLEDMGLDLSFDGIWGMITGALGENVTLPKLDAGYLATLGKLTWKDTKRTEATYTPLEAGKAAYIEANKADVLIYLIRYIFDIINNPEAFNGLLGAFVTKEIQDTNEDGSLKFENDKPVMIKVPDEEKIAELMTTLTDFGLFEIEADKAIAAIVELFNQVEYDTLKDYVWYVSELNEDTVVGMTPAIQQYLGYDNNWTKETATYLVENVNAIISAVVGEDFDLTATLTDLIGGLFTNANITALAKALSALDLNAIDTGDLDLGDLNALVNKFAGLDLSGFAAYADLADDATWGFEDGDREGFVAALKNLLAPLNPVIDFILAGKNLTLLDDVDLIGYNGYDSAIVPLLEALGAENLAAIGDKSGLEAVLDAVLATVDAILADPIDGILNLIPGLLYFVKSNGLTTAVRNLLQPVFVILETIDPIYALNLNELIGGLTADLGFTLDLGDLSFEAIFNILGAVVALDLSEVEEIIDDVCEVITPVTYKSASSLIGENGKKGAYGDLFDAADLVTVLVSFALSWVQEDNNAEDLVALIAGDDAAKAAEIQKYITGAITIIGGIDPTYESIDWDYNFPADYDDSIFESGLTIQPTINTITYPTNWTEDTAKYVAENLDEIADEIIGLVDEKYGSVADFIADKLTIYSSENVDAIVTAVAGLLADIDEVLVKTVGLVLGADIDALKAYKAPDGIDTAEEFAAALTEILATIQPVLDWLLFGGEYNFFSKSGTNLVTIKGAEGYAYGLAPILEALGVDAPAKDEATVATVLEAVFARVDAILADPVNEVFDLLPNVIYFLNANGVSTSVKNLLAGVTALTNAVSEEFGLEINLMTVFNDLLNGLLPEDTTVTLDVENLDLESIFALVQELIGLNLAPIANILVDLCVGNIVAYESASGEYGFKMQYNDDFARYDMITIIVSCLLQIIKLDANAEALKDMLGEEAYEAILNVLSLDENVPVQDFNWALTDKADTDYVFSAIETSPEYSSDIYGMFYTKENADYIADNFGEFIDNVVYLLGLDVDGDGTTEEKLTDVLNGLVGGSVYNSDIVITIRDAIAGLAGKLEDSIPAGAHILEILKLAEIADLKKVATVEVPEFTDDRDAFVAALCDVLEPLYPVLEWLFADADITFFIDEAKDTLVTLPGAEGYAFGIIPVLEVLGCEGILTRDEYNAAVEADRNVLLTSILTPLLDRVDVILGNPAEEILDMLPNIIYFINSNGVDTVVKNTLNAVYTLLNAIEPIAKIDLYELIGIDFATIDFSWLLEKAVALLGDQGYSFTIHDFDAIAELTVGTLESYTSANGNKAYKMVYAEGESGTPTEMVTVAERLIITFIADEQNRVALMALLKEELGMTDETAKYVDGLIKLITESIRDTSLGMELALSTVYYVFYGVDTGVGSAVGGKNNLKDAWKDALGELGEKNPAGLELLEDILGWDIFEDILDSDEGLAPNGLIKFFQKIVSWFQGIINFFKNLFN